MTDETQIAQLLNRYASAYDRQDLELLESCYVTDAVLTSVTPSGAERRFKGIAEILTNASRTFSAVTWTRRHVITNVLIDVVESRAEAQSYLLLLDAKSTGVEVVLTGVYTDELTKTDEGWRISTRRLVTDVDFVVGGPAAGAGASLGSTAR